ASHRPRQRRELAAAYPELPVTHLVLVLEQPTRRRPRGPRAVLVIRAAVAGAHEEPRLREPAHRAAEGRAVDREHLELLAADPPPPARDLRGGAVPGPAERIPVRRQARLPLGKAPHHAELDPLLAHASANGPQDVPENRDPHQRGRDPVQRKPELE